MEGTVKLINLYGGGSQGGEQYMEVPFSGVDNLSVDHSFGRIPSVSVLDETSTETSCELRHESVNRLVILFTKTTSGKVILN